METREFRKTNTFFDLKRFGARMRWFFSCLEISVYCKTAMGKRCLHHTSYGINDLTGSVRRMMACLLITYHMNKLFHM